MKAARRLLFVAVMALWVASAAGLAMAAPAVGEPIDRWVPAHSLPPELLDGTRPKLEGMADQAMDLVLAELGQSYRWISFVRETPVFARDAEGRFSFTTALRFGVIFEGSDAEVKQRVAQGLFDRMIYLRIGARQEGAGWGPLALEMVDPPQLPVPALPEGGPDGSGETVRGWPIGYANGVPIPPLGAGLNLTDQERLMPLVEQLAGFPPEVIAGVDPTDTSLVLSSQLVFEAAAVAGRPQDTIVVVRRVNAYRRAPWMDSLWGQSLADATAQLDDAARAAGVAPAVTRSQRMLLERRGDHWEVVEHRILPGEYTLAVAPPLPADRVIGLLGMLGVPVAPRLRIAEAVDLPVAAAASGLAAVVLTAWAGAQAMAMARGVTAWRQLSDAAQEVSGTKVAKLVSDGMDWLFRPLERPLASAMRFLSRKVGLFRDLLDEDHGTLLDATAPALATEGGRSCAACGSAVQGPWRYCTGCGVHLEEATEQIAGGEQP